jgi:hypothetical protein
MGESAWVCTSSFCHNAQVCTVFLPHSLLFCAADSATLLSVF